MIRTCKHRSDDHDGKRDLGRKVDGDDGDEDEKYAVTEKRKEDLCAQGETISKLEEQKHDKDDGKVDGKVDDKAETVAVD